MFFFNDPATTEIYTAPHTLSLHDALPIFRPTSGKNAGNIWQAGTLEWLPNDAYGLRSVPRVTSREPLWDQPGLAGDVGAGRYYLRSEEHTYELQSLMRISYAVFCLKTKKNTIQTTRHPLRHFTLHN